jgi:hypothetical protein
MVKRCEQVHLDSKCGEPDSVPREAAGVVAPSSFASDMTCKALRVASCAVMVQVAWHAGAITATKAMTILQREVSRSGGPAS